MPLRSKERVVAGEIVTNLPVDDIWPAFAPPSSTAGDDLNVEIQESLQDGVASEDWPALAPVA